MEILSNTILIYYSIPEEPLRIVNNIFFINTLADPLGTSLPRKMTPGPGPFLTENGYEIGTILSN